MGVGAVDSGLNLADFTPRSLCPNERVDIAGPGVLVFSAWPSAAGSYNIISGTSMAAPHVTGMAALLSAANGGRTRPCPVEPDHGRGRREQPVEPNAPALPSQSPRGLRIRAGQLIPSGGTDSEGGSKSGADSKFPLLGAGQGFIIVDWVRRQLCTRRGPGFAPGNLSRRPFQPSPRP